MKESKTFDFLWKVFLIFGFMCVGLEIFVGEELNATWPLIVISNVYLCASKILEALDKSNNNT